MKTTWLLPFYFFITICSSGTRQSSVESRSEEGARLLERQSAEQVSQASNSRSVIQAISTTDYTQTRFPQIPTGLTVQPSFPSIRGNGFFSSEESELFVGYHNRVRKEVNVAPLEWSDELSAYAQEWANKLARTGAMKHRIDGKYGENIAVNTIGTLTSGAEQWYAERKYFKGRSLSNSNLSKVGHYTQMVWRKSMRLGAGKSKGKNGYWYIVANYDPPGNYLGEKPY